MVVSFGSTIQVCYPVLIIYQWNPACLRERHRRRHLTLQIMRFFKVNFITRHRQLLANMKGSYCKKIIDTICGLLPCCTQHKCPQEKWLHNNTDSLMTATLTVANERMLLKHQVKFKNSLWEKLLSMNFCQIILAKTLQILKYLHMLWRRCSVVKGDIKLK